MSPFSNGLFNARQTVGNMPIPDREERVNHLEAFTGGVAEAIKSRDGHTCRCGRSQFDGWYIDASHKDHNKRNPYYNHESNGKTECKIHHLETHIQILKKIWSGESQENEHWANASIKMLVNGMWFQGLNGYREVTFEDRQEINRVFENYGVEISDYINLSKTEY